jgi:hypothetical protein
MDANKIWLEQAHTVNYSLLNKNLANVMTKCKTNATNANEIMKAVEAGSHDSPIVRPMPQFFAEQTTFSTKKDRETPKLVKIYPPTPPVKSCPPISRLKPRKHEFDGARLISFKNSKTESG